MSPSYIDLRGLTYWDKETVVFAFLALYPDTKDMFFDWFLTSGVVMADEPVEEDYVDAYSQVEMIFLFEDPDDLFVAFDPQTAQEYLEETRRVYADSFEEYPENSLVCFLNLTPSTKGGLISTQPSEVLSMSIKEKLIERPIHLNGRDITIMNVDSLVSEIKHLKEFRKELTELELAESCPKIQAKIDEVNEAIGLCVEQINKD